LKTASALLAILAALTTAAATLQPQPRALAIPPQMIIDDLRESYSLLFAEEVEVRYRAPQAPVRTDSFTVRIDPGDDPDHRPARLRLDLGPLRILFADGQMTAVSQAAPEVYFRQHYQGPITPALLARVLPPLPLPQLALAALHGDAFSSPTVYTPDIHWVSGTLEADGRPAIMTMIGSGPSGNVEVTANAETARLTRMVLQIRSAGSEAPMVLTMRAIEPGDPETWSIDIGARRAVDSLSELRPSARPGPLAPGREVPDLGFTAPDKHPLEPLQRPPRRPGHSAPRPHARPLRPPPRPHPRRAGPCQTPPAGSRRGPRHRPRPPAVRTHLRCRRRRTHPAR
jgi:hypothetical protein